MTYTPLLAATDFDGIKADVMTAGGGILTIAIIMIAIGLLIRVLSR